MFEGVGASEWLSMMAVAAVFAGLIGLVPRAAPRWALLVAWLLAPGLLGAAASSVSNVGEFFGIALLIEFFVGIPWTLASLVAFVLVRLVVRRRRKAKG